jgi:hypothetical protein
MNNDRSELIEQVINREFQHNCSAGVFTLAGGVAGTLNEITGEHPNGAGVGIEFADGSQYKISITRIK